MHKWWRKEKLLFGTDKGVFAKALLSLSAYR
jgi:hypothetical protein